MRRIVLFFLLAGMPLPILAASSGEKLRVVSTIKPIHMLVSAIGGDQVVAERLLPDFADPHHYSLRPSDLRKLNRADVIFRISEDFERFINAAIEASSQSVQVISLAQTPQLGILPLREAHDHHEHEADHDADLHIWLDPGNAILIGNVIVNALIQRDPGHKTVYEKNHMHLVNSIREMDKQIKDQLADVSTVPYVTFHDAWQYFEKHYGLTMQGSITLHEELPPGAKTIHATREHIQRGNIPCLVAESHYRPALIHTLTEGIAINVASIDVLGSDVNNDVNIKDAYVNFLGHLAKRFHRCLSRPKSLSSGK